MPDKKIAEVHGIRSSFLFLSSMPSQTSHASWRYFSRLNINCQYVFDTLDGKGKNPQFHHMLKTLAGGNHESLSALCIQ
jgi:hypothetical protein